MIERRDELADALAAVRVRIEQACLAAGRASEDLTLVAVTKTFPAADAATLVGLGVTDLGENRDQEARPKVAALDGLGLRPRWHFVGRVQRNKASSIARYADVVHSVDRPELAQALGTAATRHGRQISALVQVNLDDDPTEQERRGGAVGPAVHEVAAAVADQDALTLGGVMAVAPRTGEPAVAFARLAEIAAGLCRAYPSAVVVSAGMSGDLEAAVAHGATHLRIGTALLGGRAPLPG